LDIVEVKHPTQSFLEVQLENLSLGLHRTLVRLSFHVIERGLEVLDEFVFFEVLQPVRFLGPGLRILTNLGPFLGQGPLDFEVCIKDSRFELPLLFPQPKFEFSELLKVLVFAGHRLREVLQSGLQRLLCIGLGSGFEVSNLGLRAPGHFGLQVEPGLGQLLVSFPSLFLLLMELSFPLGDVGLKFDSKSVA
jgi:hypothetical protein